MRKILFIILTFLISFFIFSCKTKEEPQFEITFKATTGGAILGEERQIITKGDETKAVKAIADADYEFIGWSDGNAEEKRVISDVDSDLTLTAKFRKIRYEYPEIFIITEDNKEITSKEVYLNCTVFVDDLVHPEYTLDNVEARIKGRGNSTWDFDKKPYRLKFNEKVDLFGHGASKDWTLIANYVDQSQIRNYLAYTIGSKLDDLSYTTTTQFAEIYINGIYRGLYLVCEQIEVGKNRVDIDDSLSGDVSFLIELDNKHDEDAVLNLDYFEVGGQPYSIKAPKTDGKNFTEEECKKIKDYLEKTLNLVKKGSYEEIKEEIDVNSFADGYIIHELFSSIDVNWTSWYLSKDKEGKLKNDPIWDFDISCGNVDYNDNARYPNTLFASTNTWYKYLLRHNEFKELIKEKLNKYYDMIRETITLKIDEVMKYKSYYDKNFELWQTLGKYNWPNPKEIVAITTWEGQVNFVKDWLFNKLDYMMKIYTK